MLTLPLFIYEFGKSANKHKRNKCINVTCFKL